MLLVGGNPEVAGDIEVLLWRLLGAELALGGLTSR